MLKKILLLAALLIQFAVISAPTAMADGSPEPSCLPCPEQ